MPKLPFPAVSARVAFLVAFVLALLLLLTRTWQLAFLAGFVGGMLARPRRGFVIGTLGVGLAWAGYLVYLFAFTPAQALASLFLDILGAGAGAWWLLPLLTVVLGLLVGGVGGLVGQTSSRLFLWSEPPATEAPKG